MRSDHRPWDFSDESLSRELQEVKWSWEDVHDVCQQAARYWVVKGIITREREKLIQEQVREMDMLVKAMAELAKRIFHSPSGQR